MMKTTTVKESPAVSTWNHVMRFDESISPTAARALLKLQFTTPDLDRMNELAAKARSGELSESEELEIDTFERMGCLLDILHSKSRRALNRSKRTA